MEAKEQVVMITKKIITGTCLGVALTLPVMVNAASFDFQNWIVLNGEQGFENASPFELTDAGLTLTAKAFENPGRVPSHVYMDDWFNGIIGGMGVCSVLDSGNQCTPSSDDNVSIDGANVEVLSWSFTQSISELKLELGNHDHFDFTNSAFEYSLDDGANWLTAMTNSSGLVTLMLGGASQIDFKATGELFANHFYIRNADATVVPVPAAIWLFGSGLIGLVGVARHKKAA